MITAHSQFEQTYWTQGKKYIAGVDEVGRGCWAGPAIVGAVIFPADVPLNFELADSKLLTKKKREELVAQIQNAAVSYAISEVPLEYINSVGVGKAIQHGFKTTVQSLSTVPDFILIDAFKIKEYPAEKQLNIIKGDQQSISIAAASIIAKVFRDNLMSQLHKLEPRFGFNQNKGYGTKSHRTAIAQFGLSMYHRTSYNLEKWLPKKPVNTTTGTSDK